MHKILLCIESERNKITTLAHSLCLEGYEVQCEQDPEKWLEAVQQKAPNLLVLDFNTGASAWGVLEEIASKTDGPAIIGLIPVSRVKMKEKILQSGCDDYDITPIKIERLVSRIDYMLARQDLQETSTQIENHQITQAFSEGPGRLLIVDDDEWNRELLQQQLEQEGHTCVLAENGEKALELIDSERFDLVLLDLMMPNISGYDVLEILRRTHDLTELPVIIVTARDQSENHAEAFKLGANDYVVKPIDVVVLGARIRTQLLISRLERRLREEKALNECVIESAQEMIVTADAQQNIVLFNRAAEKSFGYCREEVLGNSVKMLYADDKESTEVHNRSLRENGFSGVIKNRRKEGEIFYSSLSVSVLRDKQGVPIGLMGISMDITERKRFEEENERLEKIKDEFLRMATHDLKNPLATIYGMARVIQEFIPPGVTMTSECYDFLEDIVKSAGVMEKIIGNFLDFHASEDGQLQLEIGPVDLNQLVQDVVESNSEYARSKSIDISFQSSPLPEVLADSPRLQQVMMNLVDNAIKFCPESAKVIVSTFERDGMATVEISDSGPGLTDEDIEKAFKNYARLSNKPTGGESSSGLGLAICKRLVEMHQGAIGVRNNDNIGATFWFQVPPARQPYEY